MPLAGCSKAAADSNQPAVATVNRTKIFRTDLQNEFAAARLTKDEIVAAVHAEDIPGLTRLIEQELMVQEAQRQGIDREPDFMRTIERFWKEALIKLLITRKQKEIGAGIKVYEPEVEAYYRDHYQNEADAEPLENVRGEIRRLVREEKEMQAFEAWLEDLKKNAAIQIDRQALEKIR